MQSLIENEWVRYTEKQKMRPATLAGYKSALERILTAFGAMPLADITASHVSTFMADLAKCNLSGKTQKNHYDLLRCLMDLAFTYDYIAISPVKPKLHRPHVERKEKVVLAPDQWRTFFISLPESGPWRCAILILLTTGMRQGELLGLQWQDIDWERRIITKRHVWEPKTKQLLTGLKTSKKTNKLSHEVGMSELMVHVLTDHLSKSRRWTEPADFVFVSQYDRSCPWHPETMRDVMSVAMTTAGIKRFPRASGAHMLRHTAATFLIASTGDLKLAQDQLGHADIMTTANIYGHTDDARRLKSAEILSGPLADILPSNCPEC